MYLGSLFLKIHDKTTVAFLVSPNVYTIDNHSYDTSQVNLLSSTSQRNWCNFQIWSH